MTFTFNLQPQLGRYYYCYCYYYDNLGTHSALSERDHQYLRSPCAPNHCKNVPQHIIKKRIDA